ncbi:hypothetical protein M885DRAFT_550816 [Pelagophyceae sp. CCMP2097]|nr:hypothetical protein M885DRAFT_550816 [Pelagophyceae sp. CCMP2097]
MRLVSLILGRLVRQAPRAGGRALRLPLRRLGGVGGAQGDYTGDADVTDSADASEGITVDGGYDFGGNDFGEDEDDDDGLLEGFDADKRSLLRKALSKALDGEARKANALRKEGDEATKAEAMGHRANLIVSNLYRISDDAAFVDVEDWEHDGVVQRITFDRKKFTSARLEAEAAFTKARRLRRGSSVVAGLLEASALFVTKVEIYTARLNDAGLTSDAFLALTNEIARKLKIVVEAPVEVVAVKKKALQKDGTPRPVRTKWTGREFLSPMGIPILVGRNRKENDYLSLGIAKEPDIWMHARGAPGAHVLLQLSARPSPKGTDLMLEFAGCVQAAADLAAFYSDLRNEAKAPVMMAAPRHIKKPPRAPPGAVTIREESGTILGRPADVPESCKSARMASGLADTYC